MTQLDRDELSFFISRDLRRAALLRWIMPFFAARSKVLIASFTASLDPSLFPEEMDPSAFTTDVLIALRTDLFRMRLLSLTLAAFCFELGNSILPNQLSDHVIVQRLGHGFPPHGLQIVHHPHPPIYSTTATAAEPPSFPL